MKLFQLTLLLVSTCISSTLSLAQSSIKPYVTSSSGERIYYDEISESFNQKGVKAENKDGKMSYSLKEMSSYVSDYKTNKYDSVPFMQCILFDPIEKIIQVNVGADKREFVPVKLREGKHVLRVFFAKGDTIFGLAFIKMSAFPFSSRTEVNSKGQSSRVSTIDNNATEESFVYVLIIKDKLYALDFRTTPKNAKSDVDLIKETFNDPIIDENVDYLKSAKTFDIKGATQAYTNIRMYYMCNYYQEL